jgi:hypothetical protein
MSSYKARWQVGLLRGWFGDMNAMHKVLFKLAKSHDLTGNITMHWLSFSFDLKGSYENCVEFDKSLRKVREVNQ